MTLAWPRVSKKLAAHHRQTMPAPQRTARTVANHHPSPMTDLAACRKRLQDQRHSQPEQSPVCQMDLGSKFPADYFRKPIVRLRDGAKVSMAGKCRRRSQSRRGRWRRPWTSAVSKPSCTMGVTSCTQGIAPRSVLGPSWPNHLRPCELALLLIERLESARMLRRIVLRLARGCSPNP